MEAKEILNRFKNGEITLEEAEHYFRKEPFEEMGDYAKLDSHREIRSGFPEVIFSSGKADEHFVRIFKRLYEDNGEVMGTRASRHQYELVKDLLPGVEYDELSHIIKIEKKNKEHIGRIAVCTAGTADIPVAEEVLRQLNISEHMWNVSLMWVSAEYTDFFPGWKCSRMQPALWQWQEWKVHLPVYWVVW